MSANAIISGPTSTEPVPFVDLALANGRVADEVAAGFAEVIASGAFVLGPAVDAFERAYADYCGTPRRSESATAPTRVELALRAAGVGPGDEVVLPANTFVATAEAVARAGAEIVLADVTDDDLLLDPASVAERLTSRTRAVVGVHLYGQLAPMEQLRELVGERVLLVEDAAQSQGARRLGRRSGSVGDIAATSFYPGKNLGAFGDAGAVTTSSPELAERLRALRNHGGVRRYEHEVLGVNSRLDSLQAVVLSAKLARLDAWNDERRAAADTYADLLGDVAGLRLPTTAEGNEHVWHLYVVRCERRDHLLAGLAAAGIGTGVHYPAPIHALAPFGHLGRPGDFPVAEAAAHQIVSLPMFPGITHDQQARVAGVVRGVLHGAGQESAA